jgi:hypothetical protein
VSAASVAPESRFPMIAKDLVYPLRYQILHDHRNPFRKAAPTIIAKGL